MSDFDREGFKIALRQLVRLARYEGISSVSPDGKSVLRKRRMENLITYLSNSIGMSFTIKEIASIINGELK